MSIEVCSTDDTSSSAHDRSVQEGIRRFFAPEKRELKCEKCFCEVDYSADYSSVSYRKNLSPVEFGEALTLDPNDQTNINLSDYLAVGATIPTSSFHLVTDEFTMVDDYLSVVDQEEDEASNSYKIRSVVNHIGSSASRGHYTADAKRKAGKKREWTRFDDSLVSCIKSDDAMGESAQKTAYMILYEFE